MKVLILSDLHLGNPVTKACGLLDGMARVARNYDRIILNGDTLDRFENSENASRAERDLEQVKSACTSRSGPPEIVTGNHDPAISAVDWIYIKECRTLIFHGDCIADVTHPSDDDERLLANYLRIHWDKIGGRPKRFPELATVYRRLQGEHLRLHPRYEGRTRLQYVTGLFHPIRKPFDILRYVWNAPGRAAELAGAHDEHVDHVVVGHTHRAGTWTIGKRMVLNTGSFMPLSSPSAVVIEDGKPVRFPLARLIRTHATTVHTAVSEPTN